MAQQTKRRGDTKERIRKAALRRFTTQGYDQTSLREIAEDLGVTKAALYHHYKSKEEILDSLVGEVSAQVDAIVDWMQAEPTTRARRLEMLERLGRLGRGDSGVLIGWVQQNELALATSPAAASLVFRIKHRVWEAAVPEDATIEDKLRVRLAVTAMLAVSNTGNIFGGTETERAEIALRVADDLMP